MKKSELERYAVALVEASALGDEAAAKRLKVSTRTIRRARKALEDWPELAAVVQAKRQELEKAWLAEVPGALKACVDFVREAAETGDRKSPEMVHSVAGAFKLLHTAYAGQRMLDVRLARAAGPVRTEAGPIPTGPGPQPAAGAAREGADGDASRVH